MPINDRAAWAIPVVAAAGIALLFVVVSQLYFSPHIKNDRGASVSVKARPSSPLTFDGDQAFDLLLAQLEIGPRPTGSAAGWATGNFIISVIDDHLPFRERGIPAIDIIDFDYPYWPTTADTADKVAPESLERVGRTVEAWLETQP